MLLFALYRLLGFWDDTRHCPRREENRNLGRIFQHPSVPQPVISWSRTIASLILSAAWDALRGRRPTTGFGGIRCRPQPRCLLARPKPGQYDAGRVIDADPRTMLCCFQSSPLPMSTLPVAP